MAEERNTEVEMLELHEVYGTEQNKGDRIKVSASVAARLEQKKVAKLVTSAKKTIKIGGSSGGESAENDKGPEATE